MCLAPADLLLDGDQFLDSVRVDASILAEKRRELKSMDFATVVATLNRLLAREHPAGFNSSWIRRNAPHCYRFIQENLRREYGGVDWDRLTYALDRRFQRLWKPHTIKKTRIPYEDQAEVETILKKYQGKLYVFIAPSDKEDRRIRDVIGISLVRLAQNGNLLARRELMGLINYTIDNWIEHHFVVSRWRGHEAEMQKHLDACIRRYRYTGSFLTYVFRTLEYAGRGIVPTRVYSLDHRREPSSST
jgi:hypothetical protein